MTNLYNHIFFHKGHVICCPLLCGPSLAPRHPGLDYFHSECVSETAVHIYRGFPVSSSWLLHVSTMSLLWLVNDNKLHVMQQAEDVMKTRA